MIQEWFAALGVPWLLNKYVQAAVIIVVAIVLAKLVLFVFSRYLQRIAGKTKTKVDDLIFENTKRPLFYLVLVYGVKFALVPLGINGVVDKIINSLLAVVFVFILSRSLDVIIETWGTSFAKKTKTKIDEVLLPLFHKASKVIFVIIAVLWVLAIWEIDITPYLAGAGIIGLVLGMALQDSLKNVFGGVSLLLDKNFHIGDPIQLESGELGSVNEIGLRSTKILTFDNEVIFIPNGQLANMRIRNYVKPNTKIRKIVEFGVAYGSDVENVKKVVLGAMKKVKDISDDPYMDVIFTSMGDSALLFKARFWVDWEVAYSKWLEVTQAIYSVLEKEGIEIPFPQMDVHMKK